MIPVHGDGPLHDREGERWLHREFEPISEGVLLEKYMNSEKIGIVDLSTLCLKYREITRISNEDLSELKSEWADFGDIFYVAFRFDVTSSMYYPIILKREGDLTQTNLSSTALSLYQWLYRLIGYPMPN